MAAVSFKRINAAAKAETRTHTKILLIMNIMLSVATILYGLGDNGDVSGWGVMLFVFAIGIGIIAVVNSFRGLTNSQICDVKLSMPMTSLERYISRLLTVFYLHILPLIVYGFIASVWAYASLRNSDWSDDFTFQTFMAIYVFVIAVSLFIDCITIFCTCCCGALAESVYFSLIAMGCLSLAPFLFFNQLNMNIAGINKVPEYIRYWTFTSVVSFDSDKVSDAFISNGVSILISCAVIVLAYFMYRKRDARTVGKPIASRMFFEFIMFLGVLTVYSMFCFSSYFEIGIIIVAIIYYVINVIVIRSKINLKVMLKWGIKFIASTAVFVSLVSIGIATKAFGMYDYMPYAKMDGCTMDIDADMTDYVYSDTNEDYVRSGSYLRINGDSINGDREFSDEQIREAVKIIRSYGKDSISFEEGFDNCFVSGKYYEFYEKEDLYCIHLNVYKMTVVNENSPREEWIYDSKDYINQDVYIEKDDADAMIKELNDAGIPVTKDKLQSYYEDEYGDAVEYDG